MSILLQHAPSKKTLLITHTHTHTHTHNRFLFDFHPALQKTYTVSNYILYLLDALFLRFSEAMLDTGIH